MNCLGYLDYPKGKGALSCLWSFIAHPVNQSIDDSHLSSLSLRSYYQTSSTPSMPFPSSSPSPHHSTTQLRPSESGEHRAARVLGIVKSPTHSSIRACAVSLHGLTIIKPLHPHPHNRALSNSFRVQYLLSNKATNSRTTARFKHAVPRLLDRLARDAVQTARKEGYIKITTMLGDSRCSHPWKVDILIGSADADYNNQLDWSSSPSLPFFIPSLSYAQHPSSFVPYRLHLSHGGLYI